MLRCLVRSREVLVVDLRSEACGARQPTPWATILRSLLERLPAFVVLSVPSEFAFEICRTRLILLVRLSLSEPRKFAFEICSGLR